MQRAAIGRAGEDRRREAPATRYRAVGAQKAEERAHQHHPLEPDVHDAGALGEEPAERREVSGVA